MKKNEAPNLEVHTVSGFGHQWKRFRQTRLDRTESDLLFRRYFSMFPWDNLPVEALGFDLGCGSGRWAKHVAPRVESLHLIDASAHALGVARENLSLYSNCMFHQASVENIPLAHGSMDFGYSLGVLHHVPDTQAALNSCARCLKPGAPFLVYLYYRFDNRPWWYRSLWQVSDVLRRMIARLPFRFRALCADTLAAFVYWPLSRLARLAEICGLRVQNFPLASYRVLSFYTLRTDALDRFGTRLEQRFTRAEIAKMMEHAGFEKVRFSESEPYWCALGFRKP
ncbi:MAG: class I SAM-dependent methyltransferase [Bdellovibrionales bacterium]